MIDAETPSFSAPATGVTDGSIRRAITRDLDRVVALWSDLNDHHAAHDAIFEPRIGAEAQIRRLLQGTLRNPDAAIFVSEGERGFRGYCLVVIERTPPILAESKRAQISDLLVTQEARRGGIGRALVVRALGWAKEQGVARCEVRVHVRNAEGQGFWRSLGFGSWMDVLQRQL